MNHTITVLTELLAGLPIGTNLAMMHVFWTLLNGQLLPSRGTLFPALKAIGLEDDAVRRAWTAVKSGIWQTALLIELWRKQVEGLPDCWTLFIFWHFQKKQPTLSVRKRGPPFGFRQRATT